MSDVALRPGSDKPVSVRPYDLLGERSGTSRSRAPTLDPTIEMVNDRFCRFLRAALLQHLRRAVEISSGTIELLKHRDLIERLDIPSHLTLINLRPLRGLLMIATDARLVTTIVETRFGGDGRFPVSVANRDFTPFEQKSMRRVMETTLAQYAAAWEPLGRFEPELVRHEFNPQFASFAGPDDQILVTTFDVRIDRGFGKMITCVPFVAIEALQGRLNLALGDDGDDLRWTAALRDGVAQAAVTLNVDLAQIEISVADLLSLQPGNVFELDRPETLIVEAEGVPLFRGRWGRHGRKIGIRIEQVVSRPEAGAVAAGDKSAEGDRDE